MCPSTRTGVVIQRMADDFIIKNCNKNGTILSTWDEEMEDPCKSYSPEKEILFACPLHRHRRRWSRREAADYIPGLWLESNLVWQCHQSKRPICRSCIEREIIIIFYSFNSFSKLILKNIMEMEGKQSKVGPKHTKLSIKLIIFAFPLWFTFVCVCVLNKKFILHCCQLIDSRKQFKQRNEQNSLPQVLEPFVETLHFELLYVVPQVRVLLHEIALAGTAACGARALLHQLWIQRNEQQQRQRPGQQANKQTASIDLLTLESWKSLTSGTRNRPAKWAAMLAVYVAKKITLNAPHTLIRT